MADFAAFLANYLGHGEEISQRPDGGWTRDQINLSLGGQRVRLIQREEVLEEHGRRFKLRGQFVQSTIARLLDIAPNRVEYAKRFSYDLADLLSFAAMSPVRFTGYHYPADEERGQYWSVWGVANVAMPVIDIRQPKLVRNFLTNTWTRYRKLRRSRRLRSVLAQMWMPDQPEQPIEMRLLLAVVTVESLKTTYARSKRIPFVQGRFMRPNNRPYSFRELVRMMLADVRMKRGLKRLTDVRNEVIHTALMRGSLRINERRFRRIHDLLREYLLRLLGYRGPWMSYAALKEREII